MGLKYVGIRVKSVGTGLKYAGTGLKSVGMGLKYAGTGLKSVGMGLKSVEIGGIGYIGRGSFSGTKPSFFTFWAAARV